MPNNQPKMNLNNELLILNLATVRAEGIQYTQAILVGHLAMLIY
jgi:hypothetical protein